MKTIVMLCVSGFLMLGPAVAQEIPSAADQVASSVLAAPEQRRADATVLGYNPQGELVTLREGSNDLICLADDPTNDNFSVACYHEDLEPYMARGRELVAQGITGGDRNANYRWKEVEAGTLPMPREPRMLHVLTGKGYDAASGDVAESYLRWVMYWPFATTETTGLGSEGRGGEPWLMEAGTVGAHVMISPPRD